MTKDQLIYEPLLRLSGGVLTDAISVRYGEAEIALVAAFNYVQLGNYWLENKAESEHAVNLMVFTPFDNVPVLYSATNRRYYSTLPAAVVTLPKARSLAITSQTGQTFIPLPEGDDMMQEYYAKYDKQIKYQLEGNLTVWYWGIEKYPLLTTVRPRYIASILDIPGTQEILLPANGEKDVLELMYAWLSGQKEMPKNYLEDGKDKGVQQSGN
jgi:hypothetical protein